MGGSAWIVVDPGGPAERLLRIDGRLYIGRICAGVAAERRLIIDDPSVSRDHVELHEDKGAVTLIDRSSNGTRVNGLRVEQGSRISMHHGDRITIGDVE